MVDIRAALEEIKASPYEEVLVQAPHTGTVLFAEGLTPGMVLEGPSGLWKEKLGALLATIERERNPQAITCPEKGRLSHIRRELNGAFVQAGEELLRLRHYLSREEVLQNVLKQALYLFAAPERARYFFVPDVDIKIKVSGPQAVSVREGEDLFIMSRMKREA
ncbi:MAG: biotin attachment protein, partial [Deltaproteobacteria bacterium]|nr:biotin attachment protein [Deltaproteobacteria bacterium]